MPVTKHYNWLYPLGFLGFGFANALFIQWLIYFHSPPGQESSFIGLILLITYTLQGVLNPIVGLVADRIRHPLGRRRPFILLGSLPLAIAFYFVWLWRTFWVSFLIISLYGILFVLVVQSFVAILPSIAPTKELQVKYSLAGGVVSLLASGCALILGPMILENYSYEAFGILGGMGIVLTMTLPALFIRELDLAEVQEQSNQNFWHDARDMLQKKVFVYFFLGNSAVVFMVVSLAIILPYLTEGLLLQPRSYMSVLNGFVFAGVILTVIIIARLGDKINYIKLMAFMSILVACLLVSHGFASFYLQVPLFIWQGSLILMGGFILSSMMAPNVVLSEFSKLDGQGREGLIFGLNGLTVSCASGLASQLSERLLALGNHAQNPLGLQLCLLLVGCMGGMAFLLLNRSKVPDER